MTQPNIPLHLSREQTVTAFDQQWTLSRWERSIWWQILDWCRSKIPDPLEAVEPTIRRLAAEQAKLPPGPEAQILEVRASQLLSQALDKRLGYLSVNSREVQTVIDSMEGSTKVIGLLLAQHHPDLTEDDHFAILRTIPNLPEVFNISLGKSPGPTPGNASAPAA